MFSLGFKKATTEASKFFLILVFCDAFINTLQVNECEGLFLRWLAGSDFPFGSLCSSHRTSTLRFVSPIYDCPHTSQTPWYILQAGCGFLLLRLNKVLIFLVFHFITMVQSTSKNDLILQIKCFESLSFSAQ